MFRLCNIDYVMGDHILDSGQTGLPRYLHDMAISPPSAGRPAGGGEGVSEKFSGKVFPKGVGINIIA